MRLMPMEKTMGIDVRGAGTLTRGCDSDCDGVCVGWSVLEEPVSEAVLEPVLVLESVRVRVFLLVRLVFPSFPLSPFPLLLSLSLSLSFPFSLPFSSSLPLPLSRCRFIKRALRRGVSLVPCSVKEAGLDSVSFWGGLLVSSGSFSVALWLFRCFGIILSEGSADSLEPFLLFS